MPTSSGSFSLDKHHTFPRACICSSRCSACRHGAVFQRRVLPGSLMYYRCEQDILNLK